MEKGVILMSSDESRGNYINPNRKSSPKSHGYSPSSSFNFNYGNSSQYNGNHQSSQQHHPRKRPGFKGNSNRDDRLIKQNDTIIRLLKEIRDRLPVPEKEENLDDDQVNETEEQNHTDRDNNNNTNNKNIEVLFEANALDQQD